MTELNHPTFKQALKKNIKRILTYWAQLTVILGGLGTLLGFYTISTYTTAIGRPDLMAAAVNAKSALVLWLAIIALVVAAYFLILMTTSILFGLSVSIFNDSPTLQPEIVKVLVWPVLLGIAALMAVIFQTPALSDNKKLACIALFAVVTTLALHKSPKFRLAVDICATAAAPRNAQGKAARIWLLVMLAFLLIGTVVSAVLPVSLILKAYSGEDTPEALTKLMVISIFSAGMTLIPVVVFYVSKADIFKRIAQCAAAAFVALVIIIGVSPGGSLTIVYSAASIMKVRDQTEAKFLLTEGYAKEDFDAEVWGSVETARSQPLISAFPLFSFGDVLLLCPVKLIKTELKNWPAESAYCVVAKNSKATHMPRKSEETAQAKKSIDAEAQKPST
ncbi:hypothetical protein [Pseudomonas sp. NA-150]|uniref:hypothetical protein n=1 Tax=Pseudomonas sp. NA-150 TaxID=3367525 RepID=UPI0037C9F133